ncbi:MFS transporter [Actinoplanes sp. NBRC 14428]|uniref:MFS-type transporter involved in bile tolerance (Atg22 family) n=1 Tax=Pseudosporangium ferrugineum TaxID=439699 RepID=A0A2T0RI66_9ACTN|nr:MFS transporter [Pseudosporangium ferrugineum]PRY20790.1 MFS-type transporter involved in bile tolerance (Atg22 family) [Pseudosporangium ferrugineum]BCJ50633.1 MFS transporter [Actinoplanes sp. NBRC 14428]
MTAYAEPPRVGGRWIALLALVNLGLWVGYYAPLQVLLPNQVEEVAGDDKTTALGVITGLGALVAVLAGPIAGALSDATTARTGRRHTWTAVGALTGLAGLALLSGRHTLLGLALCWCLVQGGLNMLQAGITAIVPDRTPVRQRGLVSGWVGLAQSFGVVLGVVLVTVVVTGTTSGYLLTGVLVVLAAAPFVLFTRDPAVPPELAPRFTPRSVPAAFRFRPRDAPDFAWAWVTRFLVQLGNAMATLYLLYFLRDRVHHPDAEQGLLVLVLVNTAATLLTVVAGGVISDRTGRRKPSVIISGYVMAAATALLALWPTWPGAIIAAGVLGLGFGVYLSVDQALITQVLPAARDRARDLGIINIANSAPQVLGPALAFPIVAYLGGYPALYLAVSVVTVLGSVLVTRIRSVP